MEGESKRDKGKKTEVEGERERWRGGARKMEGERLLVEINAQAISILLIRVT